MEQIRTKDWMEHIWKISKAGAILVLIAILTPASSIMESSGSMFIWYFSFWILATGDTFESGFASDLFVSDYDIKYMVIGGVTILLLIIAMVAMISGGNKAKKERNFKSAAGTSAAGAIFAFIGPGAYYGYLKEEFAGYWMVYDPSFGVILAVIGGVLGIIGAIAAGYAYSLEIKGEPIAKAPYTPMPEKMPTDTQIEPPSQGKTSNFCKNCGAKLLGPYCQECGVKAEF